jgi:hypothetical protein
MLFCIVGMVALVIDGSSIYSQQRRMQADLDMAVKVSADELPNTSTAQTDGTNLLVQRGYSNPGITINVPPQTAPYNQKACQQSVPQPCYAEGFLTQNVRSFFAGVLGLQRMKISVHAVAEHGGNTWQPPTLLALDPDASTCGVSAQGTASGVLDANVHSNSQTCRGKSDSMFATGEVVSDVPTSGSSNYPITSTANGDSGNGTGTFMPNPYNPNWLVPSAMSSPNPNTCNGPAPCSVCGYTIAPGDTYYQPDSNSGVYLMSNTFQTQHGTTDFLPYCDPTTGKPTFGIYLFNGNFKMTVSPGNPTPPVVNVYDSTFVFNYSAQAALLMQGGSLNMWGPCVDTTVPCSLQANSTNPFYGSFGSIVIWQVGTPTPCNNPINSTLQGGASGTIEGIVDLPCMITTVTGNSSNPGWINGGLVAWAININGGGSGIVTQSCNLYCLPRLPRGSVLVQ